MRALLAIGQFPLADAANATFTTADNRTFIRCEASSYHGQCSTLLGHSSRGRAFCTDNSNVKDDNGTKHAKICICSPLEGFSQSDGCFDAHCVYGADACMHWNWNASFNVAVSVSGLLFTMAVLAYAVHMLVRKCRRSEFKCNSAGTTLIWTLGALLCTFATQGVFLWVQAARDRTPKDTFLHPIVWPLYMVCAFGSLVHLPLTLIQVVSRARKLQSSRAGLSKLRRCCVAAVTLIFAVSIVVFHGILRYHTTSWMIAAVAITGIAATYGYGIMQISRAVREMEVLVKRESERVAGRDVNPIEASRLTLLFALATCRRITAALLLYLASTLLCK